MRVDMIVVSSLLVHFVLKKFRIQKIRVSSYSMKEGILADILTRIEVNS
jgi:exopolyphosphatase/guanosine-5'-triphosphate,3'-diphosphate pyrophosphatase